MHLFDTDVTSRVLPGQSALEARISPNWSINGLPNGGYQAALLASAAKPQDEGKRLAIMTATFIARTEPGDARIAVEPIAASQQFERFETRLYQTSTEGAGTKEKLRGIVTFVELDLSCTLTRREAGPPEVAARNSCMAIPPMPKFTLFDQMELLFDPGCTGWMKGESLSEKSEQRGWIRFKEERAFDAAGVLLAADAFPPPVYASQGLSAWVPTIELTVNIRTLPKTPWLKCIFRTRFITCGLLEEDGELWDEAGDLVALSRQIAHFRS
jgi:hypothetical protein